MGERRGACKPPSQRSVSRAPGALQYAAVWGEPLHCSLPILRSTLPGVKYQSAEDRLNPITPEGVDDTTLGGYPLVHGRAPSFEGADGQPYTVGIDTDRAAGRENRWVAYLVFVRWAQTGSAIMDHMETPDLAEAASEAEARAVLEELPLHTVREILDQEIARRLADAE
jgi:hypothetical protein